MTAKKSTAKKSTTAKEAPAGVTPPPPPGTTEEQISDVRDRIRQTDDEARAERLKAANEAIESLAETVTQREWLLVAHRLDKTRDQINADGSLRLLALAWIKEKRDHGGADWDRLLDMTDKELLEVHGISQEDSTAEEERLKAEARRGA